MLFASTNVNAQACAGAFTIDGVQPSIVSNTSAVAIVVTGLGFTNGASVVLQSYGGLNTTVVNGNILNATLPAGVPPGSYSIRVINGDGSCQDFGAPLAVTGLEAAPTMAAPTSTPEPTNTPQPTAFIRPILNIDSYGASSAIITPGQDFDFDMTLVNWGQTTATNIVVSFTPGDFNPRATGGVRTVGSLAPNEKWRFYQPFTASTALWGKNTGTVQVKVDYTDANGKPYSETFTLSFNLTRYITAVPTQTPTATPSLRPKLLITNYHMDVDSIRPGSQLALTLEVQNAGAATAKGVALTFGGISGGTPGSEYNTFAPQNSSNLQFVGDLSPGQMRSVVQPLTVNGATKPGAYSLKFSLTYTDEGGQSYTDDQVITLQVQSPPSLEIGFSEEPEIFVAGETSALPLQVINRGLNAVTLGNMKVTAEGATLKNNVVLVGALDAGNYFTLDATIIPKQGGKTRLTVSIDYTDAFNQPQVVTQTLEIEVEGRAEATPNASGNVAGTPAGSGGFWESVWAAILGFLGAGG